MNNKGKCDDEFNQIMLQEVLPAIAKAYCLLYGKVNGLLMRAKATDASADVFKMKSDQSRALVDNYIQKQEELYLKLFEDTRSVTQEG